MPRTDRGGHQGADMAVVENPGSSSPAFTTRSGAISIRPAGWFFAAASLRIDCSVICRASAWSTSYPPACGGPGRGGACPSAPPGTRTTCPATLAGRSPPPSPGRRGRQKTPREPVRRQQQCLAAEEGRQRAPRLNPARTQNSGRLGELQGVAARRLTTGPCDPCRAGWDRAVCAGAKVCMCSFRPDAGARGAMLGGSRGPTSLVARDVRSVAGTSRWR